jgi:hypothetical protein
MGTPVLREIENLLAEAAKNSTWGQIQIDLQAGQPVILRSTITRKLENNRECNRSS